MSDLDRHQKPLPNALLDIRRLLLTPNPEPRYPRADLDDAKRLRNIKSLVRLRSRGKH